VQERCFGEQRQRNGMIGKMSWMIEESNFAEASPIHRPNTLTAAPKLYIENQGIQLDTPFIIAKQTEAIYKRRLS
jgi:hypothetical protein